MVASLAMLPVQLEILPIGLTAVKNSPTMKRLLANTKMNLGILAKDIAIMRDGLIVQQGTPEQIVAHPANAYVREFTMDVPRVKVLTARSVMTPLTDADAVEGQPVAADTSLEKLLQRLASSDRPMAVVNEGGQVVGALTHRAVMLALAEDGNV